MSEFKFACPVCGQHMMCDASQGGSVMDCPTCFQKIIAPQAPAKDSKFILTGTKLTEKKITARVGSLTVAGPEKKFPWALVITAVIVLVAAAGVYFFIVNPPGHHYDWTARDIGDVHVPGSYSQSGGRINVAGSGADIWFHQDAFNYVCMKLDGDGTITARVVSMDNTDPWAKTGVMFRDSIKPDAMFALACVTPVSGIAFQQRTDDGADASMGYGAAGIAAPHWVRLTRQNDVFTAYNSADGTSWNEMGKGKISMGRQVYAGLFVCAHNNNALCQAQFDHVTLTGHIQPVSAVASAPAAPPEKPAPGAPPASDTNWSLDLGTNPITDSPVAGRIHGQDFLVERASFSTNGILTFRAGSKGPLEFGFQINFGGAQAESLSGQSINVKTDVDKAAKISLRWKDYIGTVQKTNFDNGYAMLLEFGTLNRDHLPGKIWLCLPDEEKSYLLGTFNATVSRPKPPKK